MIRATTTRPRTTLPFLASAATAAAAVVLSAGCTMHTTEPTTRPASWSQQAKSDPFRYDPSATEDWPSVSGGAVNNFDKNAFKRDLNNVLNP